MAADINPNRCDNCNNENLRELWVCCSRRCNPNVALCDVNCNECGIPCNIFGHVTCWQSHITGNTSRQAEHRGRPAEDRLRVNDILQSETNNKKQQMLHEQDKKGRWFIAGSVRSDGSYGILFVTDRFEFLTTLGDMQSSSTLEQFPSLVSFIGETGAGKSTLIRALIKMAVKERSEYVETPVTRVASPDKLASPTSSGVHLYKDPATIALREPILFADCEGFNAGAGVPTSRTPWTHEDDNRVIQKLQISSRLYAGDSKTSAVEELYSRFLYAFSDVICFVTKSEQTITLDFQRLLEWASRGLQTSVNQTQRRTLIIILNARQDHDPGLMDETVAEERIFNSVGNVWLNSDSLNKIVCETNRPDTPISDHIRNTKDFLYKYFPFIKVCYVPLQVNIHSDEVESQYRLLRKQLMAGSVIATSARERTWLHYNIQDLSRLYSLAFEHYATSQMPFDFYRAARKDNPNPKNMTDHIMNLLRHVDQAGDSRLSQLFPKVVASTLLNDALRADSLMYEPRHVWDLNYSAICHNGVLSFYLEHAACYDVQGEERCICRANTHDDGHRYPSGEVRKGLFEPRNLESHVSKIKDQIRSEFLAQYSTLCRRGFKLKRPTADDIVKHRRKMLADAVGARNDTSNARLWCELQSYKTCFTCLRMIPDHVLPCGHALCENCATDFGTASQKQESVVEIHECVLCLQTWAEQQLVRIKPRCAGVRILTLDGGGVRGALEIAILLKIEERIGLGLPIREFFDLIIGTSTGGIIALGMGVKNMELADLLVEFKKIAKETFKSNRAFRDKVSQAVAGYLQNFLLSIRVWDSIYPSEPLKKQLQTTLHNDLTMFGAATNTGRQRLIRVAVTTVKNGGKQPTVIANYNHRDRMSLAGFERAENETEELKAWEAGLCTSAAPVYFAPYRKEATKTSYLDGGLNHNNPVFLAKSEYFKIWPNCILRYPDILISVGTGLFKGHNVELPKLLNDSWLSNLFNSYLANVNGENTWKRFSEEGFGRADPEVYHRLNHQFSASNGQPTMDYCRLDDYQKIEELLQKFGDAFDKAERRSTGLHDAAFRLPSAHGLNDQIDQIANLLIAKLFYFEPSKGQEINYQGKQPSYKLYGKILCRLERDSTPLKKLVERVNSFHAAEDSYAEDIECGPQLEFWDGVKTAVRDSDKRFEIEHTIETVDPDKIQIVFVKLSEYGRKPIPTLPISGFPCTFKDLADAASMQPGWRTPNPNSRRAHSFGQ